MLYQKFASLFSQILLLILIRYITFAIKIAIKYLYKNWSYFMIHGKKNPIISQFTLLPQGETGKEVERIWMLSS
jgi:hypothetical protein